MKGVRNPYVVPSKLRHGAGPHRTRRREAQLPRRSCRECCEEYEAPPGDNGFCSDDCERRYDAGIGGLE